MPMGLSRHAFIFGLVLVFGLSAKGQSVPSNCDPTLGLSKMEHMPPKGRLQDVASPQSTRIIELGKKAIPLLIACLTDETETRKPIEDYWPVTTVGDIAFFLLCDLFTDSSWQHSTLGRWSILRLLTRPTSTQLWRISVLFALNLPDLTRHLGNRTQSANGCRVNC